MIEEKSLAFVIGDEQRKELETLVEFPLSQSVTDLAEISEEISGSIDFIISSWGAPIMDDAFLNRFPKLKAVFHAGGSVKGFATKSVWERDIRVTSAARINAIPTAIFAFSQIIFCLKHGWQTALEMREQKQFRELDNHIPGTVDSTVGILSLGHIGREVVKRLKDLEINIIAFDPYVSNEFARELGVELTSLDDVFARSHVVSCHTPLLPETKGLLRQWHFESMPPGASFVNTARGAIVNEPELIEALKRRPDLFAALDVTDPEP
ncbi:MAG: glycerate dehydrogenase, partial [Opitutae bacterium]|nr:glycerate dehydrogenase [Opitutae bacterium]